MKVKALKTACLAVGLATAWGGQANAGPSQSADQIQLTIDPNQNLSHVYFLYATNATGEPVKVLSLPDLIAGVSTTETVVIQNGFSQGPFNQIVYSVIGLYDETNQLVTIGFNSPAAASVIGTNFNTEFPSFTESGIATALLNNDVTTISNFLFRTVIFGPEFEIPVGTSGELVNFSGGTVGGSLSATFVPEPSPALLASFGALTLLIFHRKRERLPFFRLKRISDP
jgi:hypothetical protein